MNKEIEILIGMCKLNKNEYSPDELAALINLKFVEGVYPYLRKLLDKKLIVSSKRGAYSLNQLSEKVQCICSLYGIFKEDSRLLFTTHTKRVLQKFSQNPILKTSDLPYNNLRTVRDIATRTKILFSIHEKKTQFFIIRSWEEPTKRLLNFFEIKLQFDEDEHRHNILKHYSAFTVKQAHLVDEKSAQLTELNMQYFLEGKDFILNKLIAPSLSQIPLLETLTKNKITKIINPFDILTKINDWKIRYVYNTDKIEGNPLTMEDVRTILTVGEMSLSQKAQKKSILETTNSKTALENIFDIHNELSLEFIKKLHQATQQGIDSDAGEFKKEDNCIVDDSGTLIDNTTPPKFAEERINDLLKWFAENKNKTPPIILASVVHNQFVYIHPFTDGNGRVARLLFNFLLIKSGHIPVIFFNDQKQKYYSALRLSKDGNLTAFLSYAIELYRDQLDSF